MKKYIAPLLLILFLTACFGKRITSYRHDIFAYDLQLDHPDDTDYSWVMPRNKKMATFGSKVVRDPDDSTKWIQRFMVQPKKYGRFTVWFYEIRNLHDGEHVVVNMYNQPFHIKK